MSVNLGADDRPANPGVPAADMAGSLMALSGILMALLGRQNSGKGDYLDISMQDALVAWTPNVMGPVFAEDRAPVPKDERSWGGSAMYQLYQTRDGRYLCLGGSEPKFARNLLEALGRPDLVTLCLEPPGPAQEPVRAFFREIFATRTLEEWNRFMADIDVCYSPVRDLHEAIHEEHLAFRGMLVEQNGEKHLGVPIKFAEEAAQPDWSRPVQGQHGRELLAALGYGEAEMEAMATSGALIEPF